ncbi:MAG: hypothetical protein DRH44_05395 [Candidatus Coatesbacteria bacterium]|nr:MAG: hypothetical protein DRH49_05270 [Candidatus Coatesbacteria bacterium]RLC43111.1 MAG: hypothetical protein DRH44_05395 [Candidatus Coatesbacteria bacterium]
MKKCPKCKCYSMYIDRERNIEICTNPKCNYTNGKTFSFGIDSKFLKESKKEAEEKDFLGI